MLVISGGQASTEVMREKKFQSRNRDACHFRCVCQVCLRPFTFCFNLAIEMLVISGLSDVNLVAPPGLVSISQSRCLSFQDEMHVFVGDMAGEFQSRNRDACHFRKAEITIGDTTASVSISQSRCLSFQGLAQRSPHSQRYCFNLAIEMLVISGENPYLGVTYAKGFNLAIEMLVISGQRERFARPRTT